MCIYSAISCSILPKTKEGASQPAADIVFPSCQKQGTGPCCVCCCQVGKEQRACIFGMDDDEWNKRKIALFSVLANSGLALVASAL